MKTIGMLGGMSPESTVTYYKIINTVVKERLGGLHSAPCLLHSVEFAQIEQYQAAGQWDKAGKILAAAARGLEGAGADMIILCTNTMHKVAPAIQAGIGVPFYHIADATADALHKAGVRKTALLGTRYTMEQDFIKAPLQKAGIEVMLPGEAQRAEMNRIIFEELCLGKILPESRQYVLDIIQELQTAGANGVVLGCTEIGLLVRGEDCAIPVVDTAEAHARAAALLALEG